MDWLLLGIWSLVGAAIWCGFYYLSAKARIREAEKKGKKPKLSFVRIFYLVTGILGQVFFWDMVITLRNWGGMR